ncbi:hypothetical protein H072_10131 [Dactylellina haptotyla CBS 200.50]|uniref:Uncharacterized protein n=1 Tax=Dactylellina haptotyla (strain CBS 200.50) TaxID=1284197 RepID=S8A0Z4_DACHA|nr:hypothetical protein H072_10131 [Dactylellina haptotyla CBS 200.50]
MRTKVHYLAALAVILRIPTAEGLQYRMIRLNDKFPSGEVNWPTDLIVTPVTDRPQQCAEASPPVTVQSVDQNGNSISETKYPQPWVGIQINQDEVSRPAEFMGFWSPYKCKYLPDFVVRWYPQGGTNQAIDLRRLARYLSDISSIKYDSPNKWFEDHLISSWGELDATRIPEEFLSMPPGSVGTRMGQRPNEQSLHRNGDTADYKIIEDIVLFRTALSSTQSTSGYLASGKGKVGDQVPVSSRTEYLARQPRDAPWTRTYASQPNPYRSNPISTNQGQGGQVLPNQNQRLSNQNQPVLNQNQIVPNQNQIPVNQNYIPNQSQVIPNGNRVPPYQNPAFPYQNPVLPNQNQMLSNPNQMMPVNQNQIPQFRSQGQFPQQYNQYQPLQGQPQGQLLQRPPPPSQPRPGSMYNPSQPIGQSQLLGQLQPQFQPQSQLQSQRPGPSQSQPQSQPRPQQNLARQRRPRGPGMEEEHVVLDETINISGENLPISSLGDIAYELERGGEGAVLAQQEALLREAQANKNRQNQIEPQNPPVQSPVVPQGGQNNAQQQGQPSAPQGQGVAQPGGGGGGGAPPPQEEDNYSEPDMMPTSQLQKTLALIGLTPHQVAAMIYEQGETFAIEFIRDRFAPRRLTFEISQLTEEELVEVINAGFFKRLPPHKVADVLAILRLQSMLLETPPEQQAEVTREIQAGSEEEKEIATTIVNQIGARLLIAGYDLSGPFPRRRNRNPAQSQGRPGNGHGTGPRAGPQAAPTNIIEEVVQDRIVEEAPAQNAPNGAMVMEEEATAEEINGVPNNNDQIIDGFGNSLATDEVLLPQNNLGANQANGPDMPGVMEEEVDGVVENPAPAMNIEGPGSESPGSESSLGIKVLGPAEDPPSEDEQYLTKIEDGQIQAQGPAQQEIQPAWNNEEELVQSAEFRDVVNGFNDFVNQFRDQNGPTQPQVKLEPVLHTEPAAQPVSQPESEELAPPKTRTIKDIMNGAKQNIGQLLNAFNQRQDLWESRSVAPSAQQVPAEADSPSEEDSFQALEPVIEISEGAQHKSTSSNSGGPMSLESNEDAPAYDYSLPLGNQISGANGGGGGLYQSEAEISNSGPISEESNNGEAVYQSENPLASSGDEEEVEVSEEESVTEEQRANRGSDYFGDSNRIWRVSARLNPQNRQNTNRRRLRDRNGRLKKGGSYWETLE